MVPALLRDKNRMYIYVEQVDARKQFIWVQSPKVCTLMHKNLLTLFISELNWLLKYYIVKSKLSNTVIFF